VKGVDYRLTAQVINGTGLGTPPYSWSLAVGSGLYSIYGIGGSLAPAFTIIQNDTVVMNGSDAWYTNFTVPSTEGTYEYQSKCVVGDKTYVSTNSFHVSSSFRLLNESLSQIPLVNYVEQGVKETRLDRWNINSWRVEGPGNLSAISCYVKEPALFQTQTIHPTRDLASCTIVSRPIGNTYLGSFQAQHSENLLGMYNTSQCLTTTCPIPQWDPNNEFDFYVNTDGSEAAWYVYNQSSSNKGIRYAADMGVLTVDQYNSLDCGLSRSNQPVWFEVGDPTLLDNAIGRTYCFVLDEGYRAKAMVSYRTDCSAIGCTILWSGQVWIGCEEGAFIVNGEKWAGLSWFSNNSLYEMGQDYEIGCNMSYGFNNKSYNINDLKQYVYINNEGKIRAVTPK
jgi:hypothetical protein